MMLIRHASVLLLFTFLAACSGNQKNASVDIPRPYDPWISRSVLDTQPRILTIALHDKLWVAFNTQTCALYKAWKGYVVWDGTVYNTAHGPQPVTIGDSYIANVFENPWIVTRNREELPTIAQYAGHRIRDGHAELMYDLHAQGVQPVRVYEMVEFEESESGQIGLSRTFTTENLADGLSVSLRTNINSIASRTNVVTNGNLQVYEQEEKTSNGLQLLEIEGQLELLGDGPTNFIVRFVDQPAIPNQIVPSEEMDAFLPLGERLIARSDCKTCHNKDSKTIGPAYVDIAAQYSATEDNISTLATKIIKGGSGVWGEQMMSAHPDLSEVDARTMVEWILSLNAENQDLSDASASDVQTFEPADIDESKLLPGANTVVYGVPLSTSSIPVQPQGRPMMAGVMPNFANILNQGFIGLNNYFAMYAKGYIKVETEGEYTFRVWSDDGSKLYINNKLVIDNDSNHSVKFESATMNLKRGYYPFRLEMFQGKGDKFLSFNYKLPRTSEYIVVPRTHILHDPADATVYPGLSLPMAVVNPVPGDKSSLDAVHPGYDLFQARPDDFLPMVGGMDFLSDGRLAVCTWDALGAVYILDNVYAEDPNDISVKRIASGLAEPLGLKVVDDQIYIIQKQELTRLVDTDGDELIDEYQVVSNDWRTSANFHEFSFGLEYLDGSFYFTLATAIEQGGASTYPQIPDRGKVVKVNASTGEAEFLATGLRTPNGIGFGVDGELFVADNQGDWLPSSKIVHVKEGAWYGSRSVDYEGTEGLEPTPPVVWLPQDEIGNSPSTPGLLNDGPYAGQMTHGEVTHGGLKRVFVEEIEGEYQGAVFRFIQGLEAGVNRICFADDGSIFVGGIGNPGNWGQSQKLWYGLQRLKYNENPTFEMLAVRAMTNGLEIEFTEPLKSGDGWDPADYEVRQWRYVPTNEYGGPKVDDQSLNVRSATVSSDRKKVFLEIDGIEQGHVVYLHLNEHFVSAAGNELWSTEAWYTMNRIPEGKPGQVSEPPFTLEDNTLTDAEREDNWKLLFDGETFDNWKRFNKDDIGTSWTVKDGTIMLQAIRDENGRWQVEDRGDLITVDEYENFELNLEWKISTCGNSGIMFGVVEDGKFGNTYDTGPEMQILDNVCHPDSRFPTHRAGDLYDMISCRIETVKPAGEWNKVRLIKNDGHVEHWLNGIKVVEYEMFGEEWAEMVGKSKFKDWEFFGKSRKGHIALQDHGDAQVWFKNIKIKEL